MTSALRLLCCFITTILVAIPAFSYRREYVVIAEGQRKQGSEVCFYRGERGTAYSIFFTPGDVACLPADAVLDFPPGVIHAFARHKDGYASLQRDYTVDEGPPKPERGYERLEIPLVKAGVVDFTSALKTLTPNQRLGVWIVSSPTSLGTFIPLVPGEATIFAPAEITVVPLRVEKGLPIAVGEPLYLNPGERQRALFASKPDAFDVILWTRADAESLQAAQSALQGPTLTIKAGDQTFRPIAPLYAPDTDLLIYRGLPRGKAVLTTEGSMWKRVTREIAIGSQPVTVEREPVPLIAGGHVVVRWSSEGERPDEHRNAPQCPPARTSDVPLVKVALLRCTTTQDGQKKCSTVDEETAPYAATSSISFDGVPAGSYRVLIVPPFAKRQSMVADVIAARQTTIDVQIPTFDFFGSLTLNGKPVQGRLIFASGQAVTDREGRYSAVLSADPLDNQIDVEPCETTRAFTYIPRTGPAANSVYDIDLRLTGLDVQVIDSNNRPVAGASVDFSPIKQALPEGIETYFGSPKRTTDANGRATFDDVPETFRVTVCARHQQFVTKCGDPVDPTKLGGNPAVVQFDPVAMRGRVDGHSGHGMLASVNPAGIVTEKVALDAEGTFLFRSPHAAPEYLIYVSTTRPLTVLPLPLVAPPDLDVQVPAAPVRTMTVSAPNMKSDVGFVGVWVGGRYVPLQLLNASQEMRGLDSMLHRGRSLQIRDIAETGALTVALGVPGPAAQGFVDVFTLPQYAGVTRHRVGSGTVVLHE